jgi:hypothetical protein
MSSRESRQSSEREVGGRGRGRGTASGVDWWSSCWAAPEQRPRQEGRGRAAFANAFLAFCPPGLRLIAVYRVPRWGQMHRTLLEEIDHTES